MKEFFRFFAVSLAAAQLLGGILLMGYFNPASGIAGFGQDIPAHGEKMSLVYLDGEHASGDAAYVHERCTDAVRNGQRRNEIDYLACFVREMNAQPKRLCDKEMKARLIRYSRSYFNLLSVQSVVLKMPIAQQMLEMEKQVGYGNDIQSALPEVKADDEIVDGLAALVQKNVLSAWDYGGFFSPNVPQPVAAKLAIIKPLGKVCK